MFSVSGKALQPEESPTLVDTWKEMEKLVHLGNDLPVIFRTFLTFIPGKVKSIGVSNFSVKTLDILLSQASIIPAVNQVCSLLLCLTPERLILSGRDASTTTPG